MPIPIARQLGAVDIVEKSLNRHDNHRGMCGPVSGIMLVSILNSGLEVKMEIVYRREVPYSLDRILSQYFDLEHLEHVHPRSFGRARLVSQHSDTVIWDLESPPVLNLFRFRTRIVQRFLPPDRIHAKLVSGFLCGTRAEVFFHQVTGGVAVEEHYHVPLPNWVWLQRVIQKTLLGWLNKIWEEDLQVGVCHGGWPGVPKVS